MKKSLPPQISFVQLKHQAKDLLKEFRAGNPEAAARFRERHSRAIKGGAVTLSDAQLVVAREYGFASWPKMKQHVELLTSVDSHIQRLRAEFSTGDRETRLRLLRPAHSKARFENYDPDAPSLSAADARLLVANEEGYAYWSKYDSFLHLEPAVQDVIAAVRTGDLAKLREILRSDPTAANPKWVPGYTPARDPIANDSIPLFCVSEAAWRKTNRREGDGELVRALIAAGAEVDAERGLPLVGAVSFNVIGVVEALLDGGAAPDGVDGDGVPMAYPIHFGFGAVAELLAARGAQIDLRFAAGLGRFDAVHNWFNPDGVLKPGAGALADPYGFERKLKGQSPFGCERTRQNILSQAFYFACVNGKLEVADLLLSQGAEINAIVPGLDVKATVLHRIAAMDAGAERVVRFMLARGADPAIRDEEYHATAADWARYHGREYIAGMLGSHKGSAGAGGQDIG
jgi:ankyrin repeat protein